RATGSGKSTTLAALLNELNETKSIHIVTLQDPVEFVHSQKRATVNQRERGNDFSTLAAGLRAALRQAPKLVLAGEMRDGETGETEGKTFYEIIEAAAAFGSKTFDMAILELYEQGLITEETAVLYCSNKGVVTRGIDKLKKRRGESTTSLTGLALDIEYGKKK